MKKKNKKVGLFETNLVPVLGKHIFGNLYDVEDSVLKDLSYLKESVIEAARAGNLHIIDILEKQFNTINSPDIGGVSIIALIVESHISLHTWPESRYATVDIYSCGNDSNPSLSFDYIVSMLKPKSYKVFSADRSNPSSENETKVFNDF
ncbi:MAG: S-adenosylmethionine decarboxylase proenzyme [Candidatus Parvarchaeum acidiphilum ARMAN-4]|jgi:S-adenosylmethionine decarboxylase|uniref:S-adenosylmethionine decarboxylase proenzyme n=1 Tax=Candidatus Parvarchaeum acidiphilum ARMAN-4 TaxID=662760 RepID=D2EEC3_PARA4|nr:MAG: S-adenosylmethionine decarboxylase proenzyme [Candidatus Parvarchaeum acidiphilum ARMAN-4]